ncbi:hypothetical protein LTR85_001691 [Meristemomyces frigidus]|nr:hypothetical protein LTR85_001691 [Meristemomyces frigidus]
MQEDANGFGGYWSGVVDTSRTPSPAPRPIKRVKQSRESSISSGTLAREALDPTLCQERLIDESWLQTGEDICGSICGFALDGYTTSSVCGYETQQEGTGDMLPLSGGSMEMGKRKTRMQTGCIPCLTKRKPCDPRDPSCKLAMSDDWNLNYPEREDEEDELLGYPTPESTTLSAYRPDIKWRRNWRERHSLNFFVNFSAPQMAGFFDSTFWQLMVIQTSYYQPAILHAITAIGALHEAILQRAFADEKRKVQATEFALSQCNRAIGSLMKSGGKGRKIADTRLALTTCVLFTCFEAMQGRCDSAVTHALQGRRLLEGMGGLDAESITAAEQADLEHMRPLVERLEVQATALLDKGKRPEKDMPTQHAPLPLVEHLFSLDHAHNALNLAMNSVMRFMQGFRWTAPADDTAEKMTEKYLRYAPWFEQYEIAFTAYLADNKGQMTNTDIKRAMVLKANHLVGTMLASVDQSAGPNAYDVYEAEFKAIVDLSREVLASFSCPPLPTLSRGNSSTPYLSFSLWVTDPLWMAISRCRSPSIRQAAFTLLSQNPRQEGIWHAGPGLANNRYVRKAEAGPSHLKEPVQGEKPPEKRLPRRPLHNPNDSSDDEEEVGEPPDMTQERQSVRKTGVRGEWVDIRAQISQWTETQRKPAGLNPKAINGTLVDTGRIARDGAQLQLLES